MRHDEKGTTPRKNDSFPSHNTHPRSKKGESDGRTFPLPSHSTHARKRVSRGGTRPPQAIILPMSRLIKEKGKRRKDCPYLRSPTRRPPRKKYFQKKRRSVSLCCSGRRRDLLSRIQSGKRQAEGGLWPSQPFSLFVLKGGSPFPPFVSLKKDRGRLPVPFSTESDNTLTEKGKVYFS